MEIAERLSTAMSAHRDGQYEAAEAAYRGILEDAPEQPDALHFLGLVAFDRGRREDAEALIRRSIAAFPRNASAHNNLGNVLKVMGRYQEAAQEYIAAVQIDPGHVDSWNNCGVLLRRTQQVGPAVEVLSKAVGMAPEHPEALHNLGTVLMMSGRLEEAADAFERCLATRSKRWSSPFWHCMMLCALGREEQAAVFLEEWLAGHPDDPVALHHLGAIRGEAGARASVHYVRETFDKFADSFDDVLAGLDYRAPGLIAAAVARRAGAEAPLAEVVDLGCGTGLCGPLVRHHCERLTGIDLSPQMLVKAAARGAYDALVEGELVAFLEAAGEARFDLALSADVLCYFGDLAEVMAGLARGLKPGGAFVATVERLDEPADGADGPGYGIGVSGRYRHRESYLRNTAAAAGLRLTAIEPAVLRRENNRDVNGLIFEIERPA